MAFRFPNRTAQQATYYTGTPNYVDVSTGAAETAMVTFGAKATDDSWANGDKIGIEIRVDDSNYKVWQATWDSTNEYLEVDTEEETVGTISNGAAVVVTAVLTQQMMSDALTEAAAGGLTDPYWNNVTLLIQPDVTLSEANLYNIGDLSNYCWPLFSIGTSVSALSFPAKFDASVGPFSAANSYMLSNGNLISGTRDFTVECWIYVNTLPSTGETAPILTLYGRRQTTQYKSFELRVLDDGTVEGYILDTGSDISTSTLTTETWHHIAVTREGTNYRMFIDGNEEFEHTGTTFACFAETFYIGRDPDNTSYVMKAYVEGLRVTNGVARYIASFTAPTARFPVG